MSADKGHLSRSIARGMVRSLTRGTTISDGARYIHVGHERWLAAQGELFAEVAEDGYSDTKFVRGAYGSGKSHFLVVVQDMGRDLGWVTSHVECKVDGVQIDRFETLYPKLVTGMRLPGKDSKEEMGGLDPVRLILEKWSSKLTRAAGVKNNGVTRPFDADNRVYNQLQETLLQSNLPAPFVKALAAYVRAHLADDFDVTSSIIGWLRGSEDKVKIPTNYLYRTSPGATGPKRDYFELRPINTGTAPEALRGLLWLVRAAGFRGLILCIDEVEELAKLGNRRRQDQALQALREHVDNAGGDTGYRYMCLYLAATPEMFENPAYFPRYDALATRIHAIGTEINWRAPVIDLDRTPLNEGELIEIAQRIRRVHGIAYPDAKTSALNDDAIDTLVHGVTATRFQMAKPRLLARMVIDELERARQSGSRFRPLVNIEDRLIEIVKSDQDRGSQEA